MKMQIILLRHAKSSWDQPTLADHERPLNPRGRKDAKSMGRWMAEQALTPELVLCSTARRAVETLARVEDGLGRTLASKLDGSIYLAEPGALLALLRALPDSLSRVMLVGHDPGLPGLALALARGHPCALIDRLKQKFPTGALAVLGCDVSSWSALKAGTCRLETFTVPREL